MVSQAPRQGRHGKHSRATEASGHYRSASKTPSSRERAFVASSSDPKKRNSASHQRVESFRSLDASTTLRQRGAASSRPKASHARVEASTSQAGLSNYAAYQARKRQAQEATNLKEPSSARHRRQTAPSASTLRANRSTSARTSRSTASAGKAIRGTAGHHSKVTRTAASRSVQTHVSHRPGTSASKFFPTATYTIGQPYKSSRQTAPLLPVVAAAAALVVGVGAGGAIGTLANQAPVSFFANNTGYGSAASSVLSETVNKEAVEAEKAARSAQKLAEEQRLAEEAARAEEEARQAAIEAGRQERVAEMFNMPEMYLAQQGYDTCTLASCTMMLRRMEYLDGNDNWVNVTESSVGTVGWTWGGVPWLFNYDGYQVQHYYLNSFSGEDRKENIIALLDAHPEGVVLYDPYVPHAVLGVSYDSDTDTLWVADPAAYYSGSAIPVESCWNGSVHGGSMASTINGFTQIWLITNAG